MHTKGKAKIYRRMTGNENGFAGTTAGVVVSTKRWL